jgi:hypothetical protein
VPVIRICDLLDYMEERICEHYDPASTSPNVPPDDELAEAMMIDSQDLLSAHGGTWLAGSTTLMTG